jgi:hypothetical protein
MALLCSLIPLCRKTAEEKLAFISVQAKENDDVRIVQPPMQQVTHDGTVGSLAILSSYNDGHQHDDCDDDDVMICAATSSKKDASTSSRDKKVVVERDEEYTASRAKGVKVGHKYKQNGDVAEMMGRYLELKTKQTEEEVIELERVRAKTEVADFSIKNYNALLATMEELSCEEREDAYDVFKYIQHMEIFMIADPSCLIWLKKKIVSDN